MFRFSIKYFLYTLILFIVEVFIALYVKDKFVRPYVGDVLVVILIYCFIRTFLKTSVIISAIGVLIFAFIIEGLQYIQFVKLVGLQNSKIASIVIGNSFAWEDLFAYTVGFILIILFEEYQKKVVKPTSLQ